jgi:hypothetical protein
MELETEEGGDGNAGLVGDQRGGIGSGGHVIGKDLNIECS